jgi:glycopeptide antibiotics resistance protein
MFASSLHLVVPALATVVPVTVVVVVLVGLRSRRSGADLGTTLWRTSLVAYLGALVAVTFFPFVIDLDPPAEPPWRPMMNLDPLSSLHLRSFWLNILMTVPLGAFLTGRSLTGRGPAERGRLRGIVQVGALALVASVSVELLQLALHLSVGGSRATDIDDVIANTAGAVLGALLWRAVLLVGRSLPTRPRGRPHPSDPRTPVRASEGARGS